MRRKSFADPQCRIARSRERVGEWRSSPILRDAFKGMRRFEDFRESPGVAPDMDASLPIIERRDTVTWSDPKAAMRAGLDLSGLGVWFARNAAKPIMRSSQTG